MQIKATADLAGGGGMLLVRAVRKWAAGGRSSFVSRGVGLRFRLFKIVIPFDSMTSLPAGYSKKNSLSVSTEKAVKS